MFKNDNSSPDSFGRLDLSDKQLSNLQLLGYQQMTPIQAQALPLALKAQDLIVQAHTGSGKTLVFALTILQKLDLATGDAQALVLCPTRELATQVAEVIRKVARAYPSIKVSLICGGASISRQVESLAHGTHVIVGTPGRLEDLINRGALRLDEVKTLVFDEADKMMDMGFYDSLSTIANACPLKRQTLMFSATYSPELLARTEGFLINPQMIRAVEEQAPEIKQEFYLVEENERAQAVISLLNQSLPLASLAFCNTRDDCEFLQRQLQRAGIISHVLHGQMEQREREDVIIQFANHSCSVLVATDVAARGLDIQALDLVINVQISPNADTHIHRIGRTGRQGAAGHAITLVTKDELFRKKRIEEVVAQEFALQPAPAVWQGRQRLKAPMQTITIRGGKKDKLRAGDILGSLTKTLGLQAQQVGKITIHEFVSFVAVARDIAPQVAQRWQQETIKGKHRKISLLS
ncbi:ATP-dependent RNA helicase DbpA [Oligella sp. MSHR50489EDL]|uniref:ATP-dependent RNA helicase DbpA n=1 Tax=Oligella sp. MSHR50489EDL TaxID=3139409 RepID=UPI003D8189D1